MRTRIRVKGRGGGGVSGVGRFALESFVLLGCAFGCFQVLLLEFWLSAGSCGLTGTHRKKGNPERIVNCRMEHNGTEAGVM